MPESPPDPHLPSLTTVGDRTGPIAPTTLAETGVDRGFLSELALKLACATSQTTTESLAERIRLPIPLVAELLEDLRREQALDALGASGPLGYRYAVSQRGRERSARLFEISGYVGPAPVPLDAYSAMIEWHAGQRAEITPAQVTAAIRGLDLPEDAIQIAGLALSSGRSLFVYGPPGNGKTALCRKLHSALQSPLWIPHSLVIGNSVVQIFDAQCHTPTDPGGLPPRPFDQRWVQIHPPLIIVGGELTIDALDLAYSQNLRVHEAPLQIKSNGGLLLIDDFGRQRVEPHALLNRWILPLEYQVDYLTLNNGQKICLPFRQLLMFATNLDPRDVTDPAFLRRMGYRLQLTTPPPDRYRRIFEDYARQVSLQVEAGLLEHLLKRYESEQRPLRCCEPRDLLERSRDICRFQGLPPTVTGDVIDFAWRGYFGNQ